MIDERRHCNGLLIIPTTASFAQKWSNYGRLLGGDPFV